MPGKTTDPEMKVRHRLKEAMAVEWRLTWHEDKEIGPGVPDASYVFKGDSYETGWLELKATETLATSRPKKLFKVEASQHQWIGDHYSMVPIHFLCGTGDVWHLIAGANHRYIDEPLTTETLSGLAIVSFHFSDCWHVLTPILKEATRRDREIPGV